MKIQVRKLFRPNGLIDDVVICATPSEYLLLAEIVEKVIKTGDPISMHSESEITIETRLDKRHQTLFTSLQNKTNDYASIKEWESRDILRVFGDKDVLTNLQQFFRSLANLGVGYSYMSEYSEKTHYSNDSPEWRFHVEVA